MSLLPIELSILSFTGKVLCWVIEAAVDKAPVMNEQRGVGKVARSRRAEDLARIIHDAEECRAY